MCVAPPLGVSFRAFPRDAADVLRGECQTLALAYSRGEQRAQVLEKLARRATRVTIPERELIEVPLQRNLLSDVIK